MIINEVRSMRTSFFSKIRDTAMDAGYRDCLQLSGSPQKRYGKFCRQVQKFANDVEFLLTLLIPEVKLNIWLKRP